MNLSRTVDSDVTSVRANIAAPGGVVTKPVIIDLLVIWSIPIIQALINETWLHSKVGWLDTWYYIGYGLSYADPLFLNEYYKISRLPWILLQFAVRSVSDGVIASWILQIGTLTLGSTSLYFLFSITLGRLAGYFGAIFFAAYTFGHASGGADYHNALAGPLFALTWWLTIRCAEKERPNGGLIIVGACAAFTIHSNVVFINLIPILAVHYLVAYYERHVRYPNLVQSASWILAGGLLATVALGSVNWLVGRDFLFFLPQFKLASSFVADSSNQKPWWKPWDSGWYWRATYLGPLAAGFLIASSALIPTNKSKTLSTSRKRHLLVFSGAYFYAGLLWLVWQSVGQTALDWPYFAYPLVFPLTGAVAAAAARWLYIPDRGTAGILWRLLVAAALVAPLYYGANLSALTSATSTFVPSALTIALSLVGLLLVGRSYLGSLIFVGFLSVGLAIGIPGGLDSPFFRSSCQAARFGAGALEQAHLHLRALGYPHSKIFVWSDDDETVPVGSVCATGADTMRLRDLAWSLTSTGFTYAQGGARNSPLDANRISSLAGSRGLLVYVTNEDARVSRLIARFSEAGAALELRRRIDISYGSLSVPLYILKIR